MITLNRFTRKSFLYGSVIAAAALGVAGSQNSPVGQSAFAQAKNWSNKELRIGTTQEFENLNPIIANMVVTTYTKAAVNRTEFGYYDANNQWVTQSMERVPSPENGDMVIFKENGADKMKVTWRIRPEAQWGDGKPIIAKDYELTWKIGSSDNVSVPVKDTYKSMEKFEIDPKNPKIFTITYSKPRWDFAKDTFHAVPEHVEGAIFAKFGKQPEGYERNTKYTTEPTNKALYSGPYRISEIKLGSHIELVRNEKWWGPTKPSIEKIIVRVIPNSGTLESNLISGNIDFIMSVGMTIDQAIVFDERVKKEKLPYAVDFIDSQTFEHIDLNLDNPLLKDARTRQALLYSIDRESMTQSLFKGRQKVAAHFVHPSDPWFTNDSKVVTSYEYSPRKARKLFTEVGFVKGASGNLELNGKPFKITFMTTAGNKIRENVQVFIKNQLAQVGVDVEIKNDPAKVFFGETTSKRKFEGMAMYAWVSAAETDPSQTYATSSIPSDKNGWSGTNYMGWSNPKVDKMCEEIKGEFSQQKRKELMKTVLTEYTRELPSLPLFYRANATVIPVGLTGVKTTSHQFAETYAIENWKFAGDKLSQK